MLSSCLTYPSSFILHAFVFSAYWAEVGLWRETGQHSQRQSSWLLKAFPTKEVFWWTFALKTKFFHFESIQKDPSMFYQISLMPVFQLCYSRMKSLYLDHISFKEKWTIRYTIYSCLTRKDILISEGNTSCLIHHKTGCTWWLLEGLHQLPNSPLLRA